MFAKNKEQKKSWKRYRRICSADCVEKYPGSNGLCCKNAEAISY